jgi:hypothetical protein
MSAAGKGGFRLTVNRFWGFDEAEGGETLAQTEPATANLKPSEENSKNQPL